jgi:extracellular elastinolytic metalloproteinase
MFIKVNFFFYFSQTENIINNSFIESIAQVIHFKSKAHYTVLPWEFKNPLEGNFTTISNPEYLKASPLGWHSDGKNNYTTTKGNNVQAYFMNPYKVFNQQTFVQGGVELNFTSTYDRNIGANEDSNINASIIHLFYIVNRMHDLTYAYGFNEVAGNFQQNNFKKGGKENDAIRAITLDYKGLNNAYFLSPPDGQPGEIHMFAFSRKLLTFFLQNFLSRKKILKQKRNSFNP